MVLPYNTTKKMLQDIVVGVIDTKEEDFFLTENNQRIRIDSEKTLKKLFRNCSHVYHLEENGESQGVIAVWKSKGNDVERSYVKISAKNSEDARKLITVLLWNFRKELYVKLRKNSPFTHVFKSKGFRFEHGRGLQNLMKRDKSLFQLKNTFEDRKDKC